MRILTGRVITCAFFYVNEERIHGDVRQDVPDDVEDNEHREQEVKIAGDAVRLTP